MQRNLPLYVFAAAVLVVGAVAFGFPASSLWILGVVVLCPLTMIFIMAGIYGGSPDGHGDGVQSGRDPTGDHDRYSRPGH